MNREPAVAFAKGAQQNTTVRGPDFELEALWSIAIGCMAAPAIAFSRHTGRSCTVHHSATLSNNNKPQICGIGYLYFALIPHSENMFQLQKVAAVISIIFYIATCR